jgi:hypothetical protein
VGDVPAGALDAQTSARLVPLQTPDLRGYAAYFQDDIHLSDNLTLNVGVRWEVSGPDRSAESAVARLDLTSPIPEMQATPPSIPAQAQQLMTSRDMATRSTARGSSRPRTIQCLEQCAGHPAAIRGQHRLTDDSVARLATRAS